MRKGLRWRLLAGIAVLWVMCAVNAAETSLRLLILKGNIEISFGAPSPVDATLVEKLNAEGISVTELRDFHPLTLDYLKQFHVVAWIGITPFHAYSRFYGPTGWQGGTHLLTVKHNAELLSQYAEDGGGLLLNPSVEEIGMSVVASHRQLLADYGMDTQCAQVRDKAHEWHFYDVLKKYPYYFSWTESLAQHPVTAGLKRIYYPAYTMRWDDNITTLPLYPLDKAWVPLVTAEPTATASWFRGTPYETGHWKDDTTHPTPVIAAVRPFGKGRIGAISISNFFLYYYPYSKKANHAEILFGPQKGKLLELGDGETPSDLGKLLINLYHWLAEPAQQAGFGKQADPIVEAAPLPEQAVPNLADVWADRDPLTTGPVRPLKILVGARSAASDGQGSVADYANAAKAAGYDMIAFTETFEATTPSRYAAFVAECQRLSTDDLVLLPGLDVEDSRGNRFLLLGKQEYIRPHLLVENEQQEPGKRLIWTGHMLLGMGEILPVAARPARLKSVRDKGALPPDLYSHCPGVAVATYRHGELVDDGMFAYEWHVFNATVPIPIAVHEVTSPGEVAMAAKTGLQTMLNAHTPGHAVHYFTQGHMSFGGNPMRYYVSSGPVIDSYTIDNWQANPWTMTIRAHSSTAIREVAVRDQREIYRRFNPDATTTELSWSGDNGAQHWFVTEIRDASGGLAITSPMRTLPERNYVRCMDRQNWFSTTHFNVGITYTGRQQMLPMKGALAANLIPAGVTLAATPCPMFQATYAGPGIVIADYKLHATLFPGEPKPLADSYPIFNSLPIPEIDANQRYIFAMRLGHRSGTPIAAFTEATITLKQDLTVPDADIWPVFRTVKPGAYTVYNAASDQLESGSITNSTIDLSAPLAIDGWIFLDPVRIDAQGRVGLPSPGQGVTAKAGSAYHLRMMKGEAAALTALPLVNDVIQLGQGTLVERLNLLGFEAKNGGISGTLHPDKLHGQPWLQPTTNTTITIKGTHEGWPLGLWMSTDGSLQAFDMIDGRGWGQLDLAKGGDFYFGNLLLADDPRLNLAFSHPWTETEVAVRVHNPTDKPITATVRTTSAIIGRKALTQRLTVPPESSIDLQN